MGAVFMKKLLTLLFTLVTGAANAQKAVRKFFGKTKDACNDDSSSSMNRRAAFSRILLGGAAAAVVAQKASAQSIQAPPPPAGLQPLSTSMTGPVASEGSWDSFVTAFDGDLTKTFSRKASITGASTLTQPASGYKQVVEASPVIFGVYNSSGWNQNTGTNDGRTGLSAQYTKLYQFGQGDLTGHTVTGVVATARAGATHYLASPALCGWGGSFYAGVDGAYIENIGDLNSIDQGYDVAVAGLVFNHNRTNATGNLYANWVNRIVKATGSKPIDFVDRVVGPVVSGIDFTNATMNFFRLAGLTVSSGGSGYVVGDILTVSGGTSVTPTIIQVATLSGSAIATVSIVNTGIYTTPPVTTYTTLTLTGGSGTGAVITGRYTSKNVLLMPSAGGTIRPGLSGGDVVSQMSGVHAGLTLDGNGASLGGEDISRPATIGGTNFAAGDQHLIQGSFSTCLGYGAYDVAQKYRIFFASGFFATRGEAQTSYGIMRASGTTTMRLTADQQTAGSQNSLTIRPSSAVALNIRVVAIDMSNGDCAVWKQRAGMINRVGSGNVAYTGDLSIAGTPDYSVGAGSTATVQISGDTTNQAVNITFVPPNAHTWRAMAYVGADALMGA